MKSTSGVEIKEGQVWRCTGGDIVEIGCVRKAPEHSVREDEVAGYIKAAHKIVMMEPGDFVELVSQKD